MDEVFTFFLIRACPALAQTPLNLVNTTPNIQRLTIKHLPVPPPDCPNVLQPWENTAFLGLEPSFSCIVLRWVLGQNTAWERLFSCRVNLDADLLALCSSYAHSYLQILHPVCFKSASQGELHQQPQSVPMKTNSKHRATTRTISFLPFSTPLILSLCLLHSQLKVISSLGKGCYFRHRINHNVHKAVWIMHIVTTRV